MRQTLSLADLQQYDGHPLVNGAEHRYLCPLCGDEKERDSKHRCLCANTANGAWNCKRCGEKGKLKDFWTERPQERPAGRRTRTRPRSTLDDPTPQPRHAPVSDANTAASASEPAKDWHDQLKGETEIEGTPAAEYLAGRGISLEVAQRAGVTFCPQFFGDPAAVFAIRGIDGQQVAATCRFFKPHHYFNTNSMIAGSKKNGVFRTSPDAFRWRPPGAAPFEPETIIITEAPIDALSLAMAGYEAIALCGSSAPNWLHLKCNLSRVLIAFDADEPGTKAERAIGMAAAKIVDYLGPYGAQCFRVKPQGAKDWNELLQAKGAAAIAECFQNYTIPAILGAAAGRIQHKPPEPRTQTAGALYDPVAAQEWAKTEDGISEEHRANLLRYAEDRERQRGHDLEP